MGLNFTPGRNRATGRIRGESRKCSDMWFTDRSGYPSGKHFPAGKPGAVGPGRGEGDVLGELKPEDGTPPHCLPSTSDGGLSGLPLGHGPPPSSPRLTLQVHWAAGLSVPGPSGCHSSGGGLPQLPYGTLVLRSMRACHQHLAPHLSGPSA